MKVESTTLGVCAYPIPTRGISIYEHELRIRWFSLVNEIDNSMFC